MASHNKNTNNTASDNDDWFGDLVMSLFTAAGYLLWWAVLFPAISIPVIASLTVGVIHGPRAGVITAVALIFSYVAWAWLDPRSFRGWVTEPVRRRWLAWSRYTRAWESVCTLHGLTATLGERRRSRRHHTPAERVTLQVPPRTGSRERMRFRQILDGRAH